MTESAAIAEVTTMYRAVYWLKSKESEKNEVYLTRSGNNKFVKRNSHHSVLCADVNLSIRKGRVTGKIDAPLQGDAIVYEWYLYGVQTDAKF